MSSLYKISFLFLASILLFLIIVGLKFNFSHNLVPKNVSLNSLVEDNVEIDYLFIGSSHTRMSYDISLFENMTETNSYIVAYDGLSYFYMYPLLKCLIEDSELEIKHLIIENYVFPTSAEPALQDTKLFWSSPPSLKTSYLKSLQKLQILSWEGFYELIVLGNNSDIITFPVSNYFINKMFYKGSHVNSMNQYISKDEFEVLQSPINSTNNTLNEKQIVALSEIINLLETHELQTTFIESPMPFNIENDIYYKSLKKELSNFLSKNGLKYIDGASSYPLDDHTNYKDSGHLSSKGRNIFTKKIVDLIMN